MRDWDDRKPEKAIRLKDAYKLIGITFLIGVLGGFAASNFWVEFVK